MLTNPTCEMAGVLQPLEIVPGCRHHPKGQTILCILINLPPNVSHCNGIVMDSNTTGSHNAIAMPLQLIAMGGRLTILHIIACPLG